MGDLHREAPKIEVYLDGLKSERFHVVTIHRAIGGSTLDHARFTYDQAGRRDATLVEDTQLQNFEEISSELEVLLIEKGKKTCLHWGKIPGFAWGNSAGSETIEWMSRIEPHHFGEPLYGVFYRARKPIKWPAGDWPAALDAQTQWVDETFVFNPELDDNVYGNMSPHRHAGGFAYFLHPNSIRTEPAAKYQNASAGGAIGDAIGEAGQFLPPDDAAPTPGGSIGGAIAGAVEAITGKYWTLPEAVYYLCGVLNSQEKWITNPKLSDLKKVLPTDEGLLRDFRQIGYGDLLPEALDKILAPFGFAWWVDVSKRGTRKITVFKVGDEKAAIDLKLQKSGELLDPEKSHVEGLSLTFDTAQRMANDIVVVGDYWAIEATFELVPAWKKEFDEASPPDLAKGSDEYEASAARQRAHRDWVLNEAGDYIGLRKSIKAPYPLGDLGPIFMPKKRRFHPCISQNEQGTPYGECHGVLVEWWDKDESAWKPLDEISDGARHVTLLRHECGVRFDGREIPMELWRQYDPTTGDLGAKVRVTATVIADERISWRKKSWPNSVVRDAKQMLIDARGYTKRTVHSSSVAKAKAPKSAAINEEPALAKLVEELLKSSDRAMVSGSITLDGLEKTVDLGQTIRKLDGRKVLFQATSTRAAAVLYPTIVGITYQIDAQQIVLNLDTLQERPRI